ncbi:phosphotriesterase family protein [Microbacterium sp. E-13]|uniref:phosphotriesterase family protein n=1 Tax=Microbacterium sp. E-13 TaxID=3404048 RepID=UPI003CF49C59
MTPAESCPAVSDRRVRTVDGDIPAAELGVTDYHEHMFQASQLLPGEELDDEERSASEASMLRQSGFAAMIDATPIGLGRRPAALRRVARTARIRIIATTGLHKQEHYPEDHWVLRADEGTLSAWLIGDLEDGMAVSDERATRTAVESGIRAGIIKVGIGYWRITPFERRAIDAAGAAHARTGAPVMVHLDHGSAGHEVTALLAGAGVPAEAVVLAHVDRNPDPYLHADLAAAGAYLGYDGFARHREWPDSTLIECMLTAAANGAAERILIGGDVARRTRYRAYDGMPGLAYLGDHVLPRVRAQTDQATLDRFLIHNPARLLGRFPGCVGLAGSGQG